MMYLAGAQSYRRPPQASGLVVATLRLDELAPGSSSTALLWDVRGN